MSEVRRRLHELSVRHGLSNHQGDQLAALLAALSEDEQAPTSVREPERAVDVHLADSLVALELNVMSNASRLVDIGAGAGFPGLPLAIALPQADVTLVDSQTRKCTFIERACASARIENVQVKCVRVEEWPEGIDAHDVALARAVAPQPVALEYAAPLLRMGGCLVDWRGRRNRIEEDDSAHAAEQLGLELTEIRRVEPFEGVRDHHLHVYLKVRETPARFPRRSGIARKKPLAGPS